MPLSIRGPTGKIANQLINIMIKFKRKKKKKQQQQLKLRILSQRSSRKTQWVILEI